MVWNVTLHPEVQNDLRKLGHAEARKLLTVINDRIVIGEPDKSRKPLHGKLAGFRRLRAGDMRIVYRVDKGKIEILIIAVGMRRDDEVYERAGSTVG